MGVINLEDIQAGMILNADLKDPNGRVLLGAGSEITDKHLKIFKMWGVTEADVRGVKKEEIVEKNASRLDPELLREVMAQGRELFRHTDLKHPFIRELFRLYTLRKAKGRSPGDLIGA